MVYLVAAYIVFWAVTFIYVFSIASRQKRLQKDIESIRSAIEGRDE